MKYKNELDHTMIIGPFKIGSKCIFDDSVVPAKLKKVFTALEDFVRRGVFSIVVEEPVDLLENPDVVTGADTEENKEEDKEENKEENKDDVSGDATDTDGAAQDQAPDTDKPRRRGRKAVK